MANPINKIVASALAGATRTAPYTSLEGKVNRKTVDKIIRYTTIGSVVAKDAVGCGMYVYQSLHNDKIPEKRRKFVSALDLTNGILMIASQLIFFFAMGKINDKIFDKIFKSFSKNSKAFCNYSERLRADQKILRKLGKIDNVDSKDNISEQFIAMKDIAKSLIKSVTELAAATILAKRIVVPFIATPLARKVEKQMDKHGIGVKTTENVQDTQTQQPVQTEATLQEQKVEESQNKPVEPVKSENSSTNLLELAKKN